MEGALVWAFSADAEVPKVLPLAFFPEPCPYRETALRALAGSRRRWHIACTSSSLAGVSAACMAGLAVTPLPKHAIRPGLRILGKRTSYRCFPRWSLSVRPMRRILARLSPRSICSCRKRLSGKGCLIASKGNGRNFLAPPFQRRVAGVDGFLGLETLRFARFAGKSSRSRKARAHRSCVRPVRATATSPCNIN